jgi:hypothetical protein
MAIVTLDRKLLSIARAASDNLKRSVTLKGGSSAERVDGSCDPNEVSLEGMSAEIAAIVMLCGLFSIRHLDVLSAWVEGVRYGGRNYGRDLFASWFGVSMDFEIKWSKHQKSGKCPLLFMRPKSGDADRNTTLMPTKYWREVLPESIYMLFNSPTTGSYRFLGWCEKELFFRKSIYSLNAGRVDFILNKNSCGYPAICASWEELNHNFDEIAVSNRCVGTSMMAT